MQRRSFDAVPVQRPRFRSDDPDRELLVAIAGGEAQAFRTLFERHAGPALRLALRILGRHDAAEDAVQEAFLRVHQKLEGFRGEARFSTWLHRLDVHRALDRLRAEDGAHEELSLDPQAPRGTGGSTGELDDEELRAILDREVSRLPLKQRMVFQLVSIEEHAPTEVAAMLELQPGTVRHHLFQARETLRRRLENVLEPTAATADPLSR